MQATLIFYYQQAEREYWGGKFLVWPEIDLLF